VREKIMSPEYQTESTEQGEKAGKAQGGDSRIPAARLKRVPSAVPWIAVWFLSAKRLAFACRQKSSGYLICRAFYMAGAWAGSPTRPLPGGDSDIRVYVNR
jgi:hypothetical protein